MSERSNELLAAALRKPWAAVGGSDKQCFFCGIRVKREAMNHEPDCPVVAAVAPSRSAAPPSEREAATGFGEVFTMGGVSGAMPFKYYKPPFEFREPKDETGGPLSLQLGQRLTLPANTAPCLPDSFQKRL